MSKEMHIDRLNEKKYVLINFLEGVNLTEDSLDNQLLEKFKEENIADAKGKPLTPCQIWEIIKGFLVGFPIFNQKGILDELYEVLEDILRDDDIVNCKLKNQLEDALDILDELISVIETLNCIGKCEELVGKLFCILVELVLELIEIIVKIVILIEFCNRCDMECNHKEKMRNSFCKCLGHKLSEELNNFEEIVDELACLSIDFIKCSVGNKHSNCDKHHNCHSNSNKHYEKECWCHEKKHECKWQDNKMNHYCAKGWKAKFK